MADVVIAGGGPTGMMLAGELALAGADAVIVERRPTAELVGSRAGGFHARTIEILNQRGIADRFLSEGQTVQAMSSHGTPLDLSGFPTRHPYTLGLWQNHIERILAGWIADLGVRVLRGREVAGFATDDDGVDVRPADSEVLRARYLVAADGGRSAIRKAAGIDFVGEEATRSDLIAEVEVTEPTPPGIRVDEIGISALGPLGDGPTVRVVVAERQLESAAHPTLDDLRRALMAVFGTEFGVHSPTWISRFTDATRQAVAYRRGRVLLAGDAAHIHSPAGGQGIGLGIGDAVNLGWKLGQVVLGVSPDSLLDSYHAERHPVGARVLKQTMVQSVVQRADARIGALADLVTDLLTIDEARVRLAGMLSGLDVWYDLGGQHPLVGRRMPDLDLSTAAGPVRMFSLLHEARPVLLNLGPPGATSADACPDRVRTVDAGYGGRWDLPVIGVVTAPDAVLIRPDGHVAWVSEGTAAGLKDALTTWFGPA